MLQSQRDIGDTLTYLWKENRTHPTPSSTLGKDGEVPGLLAFAQGFRVSGSPYWLSVGSFPRRRWSQLAPKLSLLVIILWGAWVRIWLRKRLSVCL